MQKFVDERGNTIYAHRKPSELNVYIDTKDSRNATIYFAGKTRSEGLCVIALKGENATLFVGNTWCIGNASIELRNNSVCYIGDDTTMYMFGRPQRIRIAPDTTFFIGNDCMFSENVEMTEWDAHPIHDANSGKKVNYYRSIFIGDHVWVARNASILKGSRMASGSILGQGAILTGKYCPPNSIHAGVPAKMLKTGKLWGRDETQEDVTDSEKQMRAFEYDADACIRPCDIEHSLNSLATSHEKIAFLYDAIYCNSAHNRFAWNEEDAEARAGRMIPYKNSFEQHVARVATVKMNFDSSPSRFFGVHPGDDMGVLLQLHALWMKRHSIWWQYWRCSFLRSISMGKRKQRYKEKKAFYGHLLRKITTYTKMMNDSLRIGL